MDFSFEQNAQGNRPQVKILGEEVERVTHFNTIQYSFISAQHKCSVHVMSNIVVDNLY